MPIRSIAAVIEEVSARTLRGEWRGVTRMIESSIRGACTQESR
jgi:hypothetical protein